MIVAKNLIHKAPVHDTEMGGPLATFYRSGFNQGPVANGVAATKPAPSANPPINPGYRFSIEPETRYSVPYKSATSIRTTTKRFDIVVAFDRPSFYGVAGDHMRDALANKRAGSRRAAGSALS